MINRKAGPCVKDLSVRLNEQDYGLLIRLKDYNARSISSMIRALIREEGRRTFGE